MRLKGFFSELNFSVKGATKAIDDELQRHLFIAWNAWVTEFIRIVPVYTGRSVGTILPLAEILERSITVNAPRNTARSDESRDGASQSSAELVGGNGRWVLSYQTSLRHLLVNEAMDARIFGFHLIKPGPYNFQEQCRAKFLEAAKNARLPDLTRFFDFDKRSF